MNINEIFIQKRKGWNTLLTLRKSGKNRQCECPACHERTDVERLSDAMYICPSCRHYMSVPPKERIAMVADEGSFRELFGSFRSGNPLSFPGYEKKLSEQKKKTGQNEAFVCGTCRIDDHRIAIGVLDGRFLMGSMGSVVGEKVSRLAEYAAKHRLALVIFSASGGARMQEGLFSLMQMAKTSAAVERFKNSGGLYISCLTNPTTGGVSASFASLGDIIIAEPDALICFAGPRVIRQTIGQTLPEGFQHAEFLLEHGMIDLIVERRELRRVLCRILRIHS